MFVSFHPLIKRKEQHGLRKRLPLPQTDQQRKHRAGDRKWMTGLVGGVVLLGVTHGIKDYQEEKRRPGLKGEKE